jgi:hypothetical protein
MNHHPHFYHDGQAALPGDLFAIGHFGQCRILSISGQIVTAQNSSTAEIFNLSEIHEADLIERDTTKHPRRGLRISSTTIPANMLANMLASEARAWSHSPLAGALWEIGFRASRAISLSNSAENNCCNPE